MMAGLSDPVLSALSAPGCTSEEFYHNEKSIEIDGTVERCENSQVRKVQMGITGSGLGSYTPNFISAVEFNGVDTPWETAAQNGNNVTLKLQTTETQIDPVCVTVFGGERVCTLMTEKAKKTLRDADALIEAAVAARTLENKLEEEAREAR